MSIKSQRGVSLVGVLVVGAIAVFVLLVGFRAVPVVSEYMAIKRVVAIVADEAQKGMPLPEVRRSFDRRGQIDDVSSVKGADLEITRERETTTVEVRYARTIPLVGNVSLLIDLHTSSTAR